MQVCEFDYLLPEESIAQFPVEKRDASRLMVIQRERKQIQHYQFNDVLEFLNEGDCLVLNDSKVIPARLIGQKKTTGAKVEFLLTRRIANTTWETMVKPGRRVKPGDEIFFSEEPAFSAKILDFGADGTRIVELVYEGDIWNVLEAVGTVPLPPYIQRDSDESDRLRYQTVYSKEAGSVAAPTAGLHFTNEILEEASKKGIHVVYVTLHVGIGTFRPVKCDNIEDHKMHFEEYRIPEETASRINLTKRTGHRVVSVGTTSARTLESAVGDEGLVIPGEGTTEIFMYPGYRFRIVDALLTNFHLPRSTLLMLVSAFYDREAVLEAYEIALAEKYRFFSYGDAMLLL